MQARHRLGRGYSAVLLLVDCRHGEYVILRKSIRPLILITFFLLAGCAVEPLELRDIRYNLAWPPPPDPPHITFLREIKSPEDIVPAKGRVQRTLDILTGDRQPHAEFTTPYGIAVDKDSVVFVADSSAGIVHRYDLLQREVSYILQAGEEVLGAPVGVAVDGKGHLYISDSMRRKVYKYTVSGEFLKEIKGEREFQRPAGIAINSRGEKFIIDVLAKKLYVFDENDAFLRDFPKSPNALDLASPTNVTVDRADNVYVTDTMNFVVRIYDREGNLTRTVGEIGDAPGSFARPKGVAIDSDQHLYVVDSNHDNFQIFDREGRLLLFIGRNGSRPGEFYLPSGIFIDSKDRIFVADTYNHRIQVFQYLKEGGRK